MNWADFYDDPTLVLIIPSSHKSPNLRLPESLAKGFESRILGRPDPNATKYPDGQLVDRDKYELLINERSGLGNPLANPFRKLSTSVFMENGIILANIDAIFNLYPVEARCEDLCQSLRHDIGGLLLPQLSAPMTFCSLNDTPGGFTQYIQWRYSEAYGYTYSLKSDRTPLLNTKDLEMTRLEVFKDDTGKNNIVMSAESMIGFVLDRAGINPDITVDQLRKGRGVDLVVADSRSTNNENEYLPILLAEAFVGLRILWPGGHMVLRIIDAVTRVTADLIYLLSRCFGYITIFKPISSDPGSSDAYLICKHYIKTSETLDIIGILNRTNRVHQTGTHPVSLVDTPGEFFRKLYEVNTRFIDRRLTYYGWAREIGNSSSEYLRSRQLVPRYYTYYTSTYWSVP